MSETVAPLKTDTFDCLGRPKYPQGTTGAVSRLAAYLGVSRQRANRLLLEGRIEGAFKTPAGVWMLPSASPTVIHRRRGPRLTLGALAAAKRAAALKQAKRELRMLRGGQL